MGTKAGRSFALKEPDICGSKETDNKVTNNEMNARKKSAMMSIIKEGTGKGVEGAAA